VALTNDGLRGFIRQQGWRVPRDGEVFGIGIRGVDLVDRDSIRLVENRPDFCNDVLGLAGGEWLLVEGSVDPGDHYTQRPLNPGGCAHLADGEHDFVRGPHRGRPAWVQLGGALMWRDKNRNHRQDPGELIRVEYGTGCNIHAGPLEERVGPHSAGCQVIKGGWNGRAWVSFYERATAAVLAGRTVRKGVLSYFLLDGPELVAWLNRGLK
jgi:hypothetical protein